MTINGVKNFIKNIQSFGFQDIKLETTENI